MLDNTTKFHDDNQERTSDDDEEEENVDDSDWEIASDVISVCINDGKDTKAISDLSDIAPGCGHGESRPTFGNIAVNKSTDIHFGNKTYYNGPVTIKQYVYANNGCNDDNDSSGVFPSPTHKPDSEIKTTDLSDLHERLHRVVKRDFSGFQPRPTTKLHQDISRKLVLPKCIRESADLKRWAIGLTVLVVATAAIITLVILLLQSSQWSSVPVSSETTKPSADDEYSQTFTPTDTNTTLSGKLRLIMRKEWLAQPPGDMADLIHPVPYVIITHTATESCSKQSDCVFQVRTIQTFHIESRGWSDIAYNFLVGGDGYGYVGRGWDKQGAHSYGFNNISIGIAFIGTYNLILPPETQMLAAKQIIEQGVQLGKISPNYKLLAHRQVSQTESPGTTLFNELMTWPHWSSTP